MLPTGLRTASGNERAVVLRTGSRTAAEKRCVPAETMAAGCGRTTAERLEDLLSLAAAPAFVLFFILSVTCLQGWTVGRSALAWGVVARSTPESGTA
jgi:hypothetical protein